MLNINLTNRLFPGTRIQLYLCSGM